MRVKSTPAKVSSSAHKAPISQMAPRGPPPASARPRRVPLRRAARDTRADEGLEELDAIIEGSCSAAGRECPRRFGRAPAHALGATPYVAETTKAPAVRLAPSRRGPRAEREPHAVAGVTTRLRRPSRE